MSYKTIDGKTYLKKPFFFFCGNIFSCCLPVPISEQLKDIYFPPRINSPLYTIAPIVAVDIPYTIKRPTKDAHIFPFWGVELSLLLSFRLFFQQR